jgi:pimeloyl-ACP methyl ester carboxylesterase
MNTSGKSSTISIAGVEVCQERVCAGGHTVNVIRVGSGSASLVWLPALMDSATSFTRAALSIGRQLAGSACVYAIDPPGYGLADPQSFERIPTFDELGTWLDALLDQLPGPFVLAGNSSGAVMAALAATRRTDVLGLALVGWCDWRLVGTPHRELLCPSTRAQLQHLLKLGWHRPPLLLPRTLDAQLNYAQRSDYREHVASFSPDTFGAAFDHYAGPLALIVGVSDGIITPSMVSALARHRPTARLHVIDDCGHYPHREQPRVLVEILVRWMTGLLRRRCSPAPLVSDVPSTTH